MKPPTLGLLPDTRGASTSFPPRCDLPRDGPHGPWHPSQISLACNRFSHLLKRNKTWDTSTHECVVKSILAHELVYDTILSLDFESTKYPTSKAANNVGGTWSVMILVDCETQPSREKYTQVLLSTLQTTMYRSGHVVWPIPQASGRKLRSGTGCARGMRC